MRGNFPKTTENRKIGSSARALVHYNIDPEKWEYREKTGDDYGIDCEFELIENNELTGKTIECQVKGTKDITFVNNNQFVSIALKTSSIRYFLNKKNPVILLLVDVNTKYIYYLSIQKYFLENKYLINKLDKQEYKNIRIPVENVIKDQKDSIKLVEFVNEEESKQDNFYEINEKAIS